MKLETLFVNKLGGTAGHGGHPATGFGAPRLPRGPITIGRSIPPLPALGRQRIYIFWHEYILCPIYEWGHCNVAMLLSQHRDAEILSHVAAHLGYEQVRGSTNRGGVAALRQVVGQEPEDATWRSRPTGRAGPRRHWPPAPSTWRGNWECPLGGDGRGLRPALAGPKLGPLRNAAPFSRARRHLQPGKSTSPRSCCAAGWKQHRRRIEKPSVEPLTEDGGGLGPVRPSAARRLW